MAKPKALLIVALTLGASGLAGCQFLGGAAAGAAGTGAAYEYQHKRARDRLEKQYERGEIDRKEYKRRKQEIDRESVVY